MFFFLEIEYNYILNGKLKNSHFEENTSVKVLKLDFFALFGSIKDNKGGDHLKGPRTYNLSVAFVCDRQSQIHTWVTYLANS